MASGSCGLSMTSTDMKKRGRQFDILITLLILASLMLSACNKSQGSENAPSTGKTYEVSPAFREFFNTLGGEDVLGPAISQDFIFQEFECQYTANSLMCLNPTLSGANRFNLYPLGIALEVNEPPGTDTPSESSRVVNGYTIYEEFLPLFDMLSGTRFAGNPISQMHINYSQQRVEQFFENVGFYRSFNNAPGSVKLLAYGALACDQQCDYTPNIEAIIIDSTSASDNQPFLPQLGKFGNVTDFGVPLTQPYVAMDGAREQVYSNAVLFSPEDKPNQVLLRPLSVELGMLQTEPGPKLYGNKEGMVFYAVKDDLGYHVPLIFDDFISDHGGLEISGNPIAEIVEYETGLYRQCFENYCLDYHPSEPADNQVTMAPLGQQYLKKIQETGTGEELLVISNETVEIQVREQNKKLPNTSPQKIDILVLHKIDQKPLSGIESSLDITMPDGSHYTADVTATENDGSTSVTIPAMKDLPNGSILTYRVCLKAASAEPVCAAGGYIIWNIP